MKVMNFSLRSIESVNMQYLREGEDSKIQIVFVPGGFSPDIWKHQIRYFSKKYSSISFRPMRSCRDYSGEKEALEAVLEQPDMENVVLVSNSLGNPLIQSFEDRENVRSTVLTGPLDGIPKLSPKLYRFFWTLSKSEPKLMKKVFFSSDTGYRLVRKFAGEVQVPEYDSFKEFAFKDLRRPVKRSMVIHPKRDRFSSLENARNLNTKVSLLNRAGTFAFYEKPQQYNKALSDFLEIVKRDVERKEIIESADRNRSLEEFSGEKVKIR